MPSSTREKGRQHVNAYRARMRAEGRKLLSVYVAQEQLTALDRFAADQGCTRAEAVELLIKKHATHT